MLPLAATVTGAPALLIILIIVALLLTGVVVAIRATGRGVKKGINHFSDAGDTTPTRRE